MDGDGRAAGDERNERQTKPGDDVKNKTDTTTGDIDTKIEAREVKLGYHDTDSGLQLFKLMLSPGSHETMQVKIQYPYYLLLKTMVGTNRMDMRTLQMEIVDIMYNKEQGVMTVLFQRLRDGISVSDLKVLFFEEHVNQWTTDTFEICAEKMKFIRQESISISYLEKYMSEGLSFEVAGKTGHAILCLINGKLHGASTQSGWMKAVKQQMEIEIMSRKYCLEIEEKILIDSDIWTDFKKNNAKNLLILTETDANGKTFLVVVGNGSHVKVFWEEMMKFFGENAHSMVEVIDRREAAIKFLQKHCRTTFLSASGTIRANFKKESMEISGIKTHVKDAEKSIIDLIGQLETKSFQIDQHGIEAKLVVQRKIEILQNIEQAFNCAIWVTDKDRSTASPSGEKTGMFCGHSFFKNLFENKSDAMAIQTGMFASSQIMIRSGCITNSQDSEVLVNALVSRRSNPFTAGEVCESFFEAGGYSLQKELNKIRLPQKFGSDLVTTKCHGRLQCRIIFHVYISGYRSKYSLELLKGAIKTCLEKAISGNYVSIAFPTLGCGQLGYSVENVFKCFHEAEREVFQLTKPTIKINIFAKDRSTFHHFADQFCSHRGENDRRQDPVDKPAKLLPEFREKIVTFMVCCYAKEINNFTRIQKKIEDKLKNLFVETTIKHDRILSIEAFPTDYLRYLNSQGMLNLSIKIDKTRKTMQMAGPKDDVNQVMLIMTNMLDEKKGWLQDLVKLRTTFGNTKDFLEFYATMNDNSLPDHWTNYVEVHHSINQPNTKTLLNKDDDLFKDIVKLITKTWETSKVGKGKDAKNLKHKSIDIKSIYIVENPNLYLQYLDSRKALCRKALKNIDNSYILKSIADKGEADIATKNISKKLDDMLMHEINEHYLFHGTKAIDGIMKEGTDSRLGNETAMFGRGTYFAESPTKADQYADDKDNRSELGTVQKMFLARVLLGNSHICEIPLNYLRPPCSVVGCSGGNHCQGPDHVMLDSVIGIKRSNGSRLLFREFIVYNSYQCYPEFLIEYVRK